MQRKERVYAVLVEPHEVHTLAGTTRDDIDPELREAIDSISGLPYPAQYGRAGVLILADDYGMFKPLPYNRWGIVGTFAVVGTHNRPLTEKRVAEIIEDVGDRNGGYLDEASKVLNAFREAFREHGIPPAGAVPRGPGWFKR
jgi:hypothetical protein